MKHRWSALFLMLIALSYVSAVYPKSIVEIALKPVQVLGDTLKDTLDKTVPPVVEKTSHTVDHVVVKPLTTVLKDTVDVVTNGIKGVNDGITGTVYWVDKNKETVVMLAITGGVLWAACIDGCTLVGSVLLQTGVVTLELPLFKKPIGDADKPEPVNNHNGDTPSASQSRETDDSVPNTTGMPPVLFKQFSHYYRKQPIEPVVTYKSLDDSLVNIFNVFSYPTVDHRLRTNSGGFDGSRNEIDFDIKQSLGDEARRAHLGLDVLTYVGQPVYATMTGVISGTFTLSRPKEGPELIAVVITSNDGTTARELYVHPADWIKPGFQVEAGKTMIGVSQDISNKYGNGTPQHVHIDFMDYKCQRFNPWTNEYSVPLIKNAKGKSPACQGLL